jgi:hypothetical protein
MVHAQTGAANQLVSITIDEWQNNGGRTIREKQDAGKWFCPIVLPVFVCVSEDRPIVGRTEPQDMLKNRNARIRRAIKGILGQSACIPPAFLAQSPRIPPAFDGLENCLRTQRKLGATCRSVSNCAKVDGRHARNAALRRILRAGGIRCRKLPPRQW